MGEGEPPPAGEQVQPGGTGREARRRSAYTLVASVACVLQALVVAGGLGLPPHALSWGPAFGTALCGLTALILRQPGVRLSTVDHGVLVLATLGVGYQMVRAFGAEGGVPAQLYFAGVFLFLAGFSILPTWGAALYVGAVFLAFVALSLLAPGGADLTLLAEQALTALLIAHLSIYGRSVSAERAEATLYQRLALTDTLTGLDNRRAMYERLTGLFAGSAGPAFAVLLLDIDHFKGVNDHHGHDVGDEVLRGVAALLRAGVREGDHVARWGGEEFLVLLPGADRDAAQRVAVRLWSAVRSARTPGLPPVTVSLGVAVTGDAPSVPELLRVADARLYEAKAGGRDQVR